MILCTRTGLTSTGFVPEVHVYGEGGKSSGSITVGSFFV
jgi:hypothetical protein